MVRSLTRIPRIFCVQPLKAQFRVIFVMQVHAVSTMLGGRGTGSPGPRGVRRVTSRVGGVEEGIVVDHIAAKLIGPLENLGSNVVEEGIGGPASQEHDLGDRVIHEKEGHGGSGPEGFGPDV